ncbi:MAG: thiolase family protein [Thermoanaerobaculales bacterium]|nr:thiolase family protein [Thermoanaerobaculales bacterium]
MAQPKVVILGAIRTPIGSMGGGLASLQAEDLAAHVIGTVLEHTGLPGEKIDYTCMGWVMQDPRSPNVARNAAERAGIPWTSPATTFHENCASGGAAAHSIARRIVLGEISIGIAGGVESMSNVARYLYTGRTRAQLYGDMQLVDGLFGALTDIHVEGGELMGLLTERLVERYDVTREEQDEVAWRSHHNALKAWDEGFFDDYVVPVEIPRKRKDPIVISRDEGPRPITREEFAAARPYFKREGGTITTLNALSVNDAAAAMILTTEEKAKELGIEPLAELRSFWNVGVERAYMGEGAFKVVSPMLERAGLTIPDIDLFELNEAFAAVLAAAFHDLPQLPQEKTNLWGSGISLGHPVGCTGARQIVDMVHQLQRRQGNLGLVSRCVGGGIGSGEIIQRLS